MPASVADIVVDRLTVGADVDDKASAPTSLTVPETMNKDSEADAMSRPPSPPESGQVTPKLSIAKCPDRLRSIYPPPNYGTVNLRKVYRGSFPQDRNIDFMKALRVTHVLTLVTTAPTPGYEQWIAQNKIKKAQIYIAPNKDGIVQSTPESLCSALLYILDSSHWPLMVHCNQGRHRTGCVIACLRRIQRWPLTEVLEEYRTYAFPKVRDGDIQLIRDFDPNCVFDYAKTHGFFEDSMDILSSGAPRLKRLDSGIVNIDMLAEALQSGALEHPDGSVMDGIESTESSSSSVTSGDSVLEMLTFRAADIPLPPSPVGSNADTDMGGTATDDESAIIDSIDGDDNIMSQ